ncbi:transcription factor c2h2 [Diplodia corticola]|uniref:Transcription factor c2h2 n=1 Tax=Diplodia corticola TaxID=236234 RepID=A0A1J9R839_9PEZI|nr:transcription factor c2h2 [Diplodia corticola]OJD36689.1 transcription factor c2h2 [Diplodia corticola]
METNYMATTRSASPSTFTLSRGRNNRLSLLSSSSSSAAGRSADARSLTRSPPPSYDGLTGLPVASIPGVGSGGDTAHDGGDDGNDVSATLDAHLPLSVSDKGWSEVESVSKQFLAENLPGWIASMQAESRGADGGPKSPATTAAAADQQHKQLSQMIKAGVRKGRKGLVLRLLRRTADANEMVDLRLDNAALNAGQQGIKRNLPAHLAWKQGQQQAAGRPESLPVQELEAKSPAMVVRQVPGLHEAPAAPPVFELPTTPATPRAPRPAVVVPPPPPLQQAPDADGDPDQAEEKGDDDVSLATSPTESLLRTLSFGPDEASAWSEPVMDHSDSDHSSPSSIVPTPTKGLSVRHAIHKVIKPPQPFGAPETGASDRARMLPLDMESLNRRLAESSTKSLEEDGPEDEHGLRRDLDKAVPAASHETRDAASGSEPVQHEPKQLASHRSDHVTAGGPANGAKMATDNVVAADADDPAIEAATSRDSPGTHDLQIPEAPAELVISTDCGPRPGRTYGNVPIRSGTPQGPLAVQSRASMLQDSVGSQRTPHVEQRDSHISTTPSHVYGLRDDASQGTRLDGSVTLPTLVVGEPDSPGGSLWLPSNIEIRPLPEKRSPTYRFLSHAAKAALTQLGRVAVGLYDAYGPEKPVPKDHVRVRWTCTCGQELHDDFIERRRGAARELEAYLNRPRAHASPSPDSTNSSFSSASQIFSLSSSLNPSPVTTWGSSSFNSGIGGGGGDSSPTALRSNNPFSVRIGTLPPPRWLLTCADEGQLVTKLSHVDVTETKIRSDRDLAMAVRALHAHVNRRRRLLARLLRGLCRIDFVQFEVHRNRVVDIRKCPDMPPVSSNTKQNHSSSSHREYDFEPHELVPPVGSQYLMHLFRHPEDYDNEFITYARAPKRRGARLDVGVGWGINLVEGFLADRVWLLVMVMFVLGSAVFAVVWACKRGEDVQGAFGVAGWMLTLATLVVGWAQASLG